MENDISTAFYSYEVFNPNKNDIIFSRSNNTKYLVPIRNPNKSIYFIKPNTQRFTAIKVLYEML